jgi:hypothetical protein
LFSFLRCPNATCHSDRGPTKRAKSFNTWVEDKRNIETSAEAETKRLSKVYGFYYLPYAFLTGARHDLEGIQNEQFVSEDDFDVDYIEKIVRFRPEAWFGGYIKSYKEQEVPRFITHLKEDFPNMYEEWAKKYPESAKMVSEISPVGRKVFVESLPDGTEINDHHGTFVKEGNFLKCDEWKSAFIPFSAGKGNLIIEITDNMNITVTAEAGAGRETEG